MVAKRPASRSTHHQEQKSFAHYGEAESRRGRVATGIFRGTRLIRTEMKPRKDVPCVRHPTVHEKTADETWFLQMSKPARSVL